MAFCVTDYPLETLINDSEMRFPDYFGYDNLSYAQKFLCDNSDALNQCKDCPALDGCGGMNGKCPYSKEK